MAVVNQAVLNARDGDTDTPARISLSGRTLRGRAAHIPEGNYLGKIIEAVWANKKDREGKNLKASIVVTEPEAYKGARLTVNHPAPAGQEGDNAVDSGFSFVGDMAISALSCISKNALDTQLAKPNVNVSPKWLKGKAVAISVGDEISNRGNTYSSVKGYIYKWDFDASPGPMGADLDAPAGGNGVSATSMRASDMDMDIEAAGEPEIAGGGADEIDNLVDDMGL